MQRYIDMNERTIVIGITGQALSGKDTFATLLEEALHDEAHVHRFAFADRLKKEVTDALGVPLTYAYEQPYKEHIRPLLQAWGDARKCVATGGDQYYWCFPLDRLVGDCLVKAKASRHPCVVLVTDVRYPFESDYLKDYKDAPAIVVKVVDPNKETTAYSQHSSETSVSDIEPDYLVENDKSKGLDSLRVKVDEFLEKLSSMIELREATLDALSQEVKP